MKLQKKLIISYLLITLIPILLITLLFYNNIRSSLLLAQQSLFEPMADSKAREIRLFLTITRMKYLLPKIALYLE